MMAKARNKKRDRLFFTIIYVFAVFVTSCVIVTMLMDLYTITSEEVEQIDDTIVSIWADGLSVDCEKLSIYNKNVNINDLATKPLSAPENQNVNFGCVIEGIYVNRIDNSIFVYKGLGINKFEFDFSNNLEIRLYRDVVKLFATFAISFGLSVIGCALLGMYVLFMIDAYGIYIKKSKDSFVLLEEFFFK